MHDAYTAVQHNHIPYVYRNPNNIVLTTYRYYVMHLCTNTMMHSTTTTGNDGSRETSSTKEEREVQREGERQRRVLEGG